MKLKDEFAIMDETPSLDVFVDLAIRLDNRIRRCRERAENHTPRPSFLVPHLSPDIHRPGVFAPAESSSTLGSWERGTLPAGLGSTQSTGETEAPGTGAVHLLQQEGAFPRPVSGGS